MELSDIAFKRIQFLRRYVEIKQQNLYQFVFTDDMDIPKWDPKPFLAG